MATNKKPKRSGFLRPTLTIPDELESFIERRKNEPQHAGNLSSYVRGLIIADKHQQQTKAAA